MEFSDRKMLETELKTLARLLNATILLGQNPHFVTLEKELNKYFQKQLKVFTTPVFSPGSVFQNKVWTALQAIPYGTTRSYKEQALSLGSPESVRAVANANGMNLSLIHI